MHDALEASYKRVWSQIKPMCAAALGSGDAVEKIGPSTCVHLIHDLANAANGETATEAQNQVAEIRAGLRREPGPSDRTHPVLKMFLMLTNANKAFEGDLAKTFGPEEAHRLAFADGFCQQTSQWGGNKKK